MYHNISDIYTQTSDILEYIKYLKEKLHKSQSTDT